MKKIRAFTVFELMVVVAIIAILLTMVLPLFVRGSSRLPWGISKYEIEGHIYYGNSRQQLTHSESCPCKK